MPAPSSPHAQIRIDSQFMFSDHKNNPKPRLEKRQRNLLKKIPHIGAFLAPDETILLVTPCVSPTSLFEQFTTGWNFVYINRALLVVTNKGLLHVFTTPGYTYRNSIARVRYTDCSQIRTRGRHLFIQYGSGKKEWFLYLPRAQRLKLKAYYQAIKLDPTPSATGQRRHLCPRCTRPLAPATYQCMSCRLLFKDMSTAVKLSLFIPGGGYFYTRHPFLGIADFIVELILLMFVILSISDLMRGEPNAAVGLVFFGLILVFEKLITIHHAKRYISEFIPKEAKVQLRPATPVVPVAAPA